MPLKLFHTEECVRRHTVLTLRLKITIHGWKHRLTKVNKREALSWNSLRATTCLTSEITEKRLVLEGNIFKIFCLRIACARNSLPQYIFLSWYNLDVSVVPPGQNLELYMTVFACQSKEKNFVRYLAASTFLFSVFCIINYLTAELSNFKRACG